MASEGLRASVEGSRTPPECPFLHRRNLNGENDRDYHNGPRFVIVCAKTQDMPWLVPVRAFFLVHRIWLVSHLVSHCRPCAGWSFCLHSPCRWRGSEIEDTRGGLLLDLRPLPWMERHRWTSGFLGFQPTWQERRSALWVWRLGGGQRLTSGVIGSRIMFPYPDEWKPIKAITLTNGAFSRAALLCIYMKSLTIYWSTPTPSWPRSSTITIYPWNG